MPEISVEMNIPMRCDGSDQSPFPRLPAGGCPRPKPLCGYPAILMPTPGLAPNLGGELGSLELGEGATNVSDVRMPIEEFPAGGQWAP